VPAALSIWNAQTSPLAKLETYNVGMYFLGGSVSWQATAAVKKAAKRKPFAILHHPGDRLSGFLIASFILSNRTQFGTL
jgi:hypothetical protein